MILGDFVTIYVNIVYTLKTHMGMAGFDCTAYINQLVRAVWYHFKNCDISYIWKHVIFKPIGISIVVLMMPQTLSSACGYDFREPYELSRLYASSVIMLSAYFFLNIWREKWLLALCPVMRGCTADNVYVLKGNIVQSFISAVALCQM